MKHSLVWAALLIALLFPAAAHAADHVVWANDHGAVCDGTADDTAAFQAAINAAQTAGQPLRFYGTCLIKHDLMITATLDFGGSNFYGLLGPSSPNGVASKLITGTAGMNLIHVDTDSAVTLHDFLLYDNAGGSTGVWLTSSNTLNQGSIIRNVNLEWFTYCIYTGAASNWVIDSTQFTACRYDSIEVLDTYHADYGDSTITNSTFTASAGPTNAHIDYQSSGGLRLVNNKLNGNGTYPPYAISLYLDTGVVTGDFWVTGNSIEGVGINSIWLGRRGTTGSFLNVIISGNELTSGPGNSYNSCFFTADPGSDHWLTNLSVTNNVCVLTDSATVPGNAFVVQGGVQGFKIAGNITLAATRNPNSHNLLVNGNVLDCIIGPNMHWGSTLPGNALSATVCGAGRTTLIKPN